MLIAHIDESGTHDKAKSIAVGGLVARASAWSKFSKAWGKVLKDAGASYYHAAELESLKGEYRHWTNAKKVAFQKDLIREVRRATSYGVACGVSLADYRAVVPVGEGHGSPYMACVAGAVMRQLRGPTPWAIRSRSPSCSKAAALSLAL